MKVPATPLYGPFGSTYPDQLPDVADCAVLGANDASDPTVAEPGTGGAAHRALAEPSGPAGTIMHQGSIAQISRAAPTNIEGISLEEMIVQSDDTGANWFGAGRKFTYRGE